MKTKTVLISIAIFFAIIIIAFIVMLFNPSVGDEDFDLMYRIGNGEKTYKDGRNDDIDPAVFSFNHESYLNLKDKTRLTIHSLDTLKGNQERVIFDVEDIQKKESISTYIDYMNRKTHVFSSIKIQSKNDSTYVWSGITPTDTAFFFKGVRILDDK